jgi:hypothetical protein
MQTRIAWFVMAHQKPQQLCWIVDALAGGGAPDELILLHIDLKSMLGLKAERHGMWRTARQLAARYRNVRLLRPRFTNWGGWSLSRLHLQAIETALRLDPDWTHFVNLSGQCYPIKPLADLRARLAGAPDQVFVELRHFTTLPADDWHRDWHAMIELPHKAVRWGRRRPPEDFELEYKGSQWSILPRGFCAWQREAPVGRRIRGYLRGLLLSDELIMQTLVRNGPWRDRVAPHYGREIVWPGPKVMLTEDLPRLLASPGFFARKFDLARDANILHVLAERLQLPQPAPPPSRTAG